MVKIFITPKRLGTQKSGALGLSLFSLMVNPRLGETIAVMLCWGSWVPLSLEVAQGPGRRSNMAATLNLDSINTTDNLTRI